MTRYRHSSGVRHSQGFSLVELMVSLVIGLAISAAAFSSYLGAAQAIKITEAQVRMNEDGQAALAILAQQLRSAGSNPKQNNRIDNINPALSSLRNPVYSSMPSVATSILIATTPPTTPPTTFPLSDYAVRGCDGQFTVSNLDDLSCTIPSIPSIPSTLPDSIAISYEADKFNTVPTSASLPTDCLGNRLNMIVATFAATTPPTTTSTSYAVADNRFYIGTSSTILSPSLYCKGIGDIARPLVENIEDMQFTYGMLSTSTPAASISTAQVVGYLRADQIAALDATTETPDDKARWAKVITVRICILVRSEGPVVSDSASARYLKCDGTLETAPPDLRLRLAYTTTVVLRNRRR